MSIGKFTIEDWVRIQYAGVEHPNLMLYGAYQIMATTSGSYGINIKPSGLNFYKENQLRHANKDEILEAKICQSAML